MKYFFLPSFFELLNQKSGTKIGSWYECEYSMNVNFFLYWKPKIINIEFIYNYLNLAHNYYWTASHTIGCGVKSRSTTPSFVQKYEKKFAYSPSQSPYFRQLSMTPEPRSSARYPSSADVPKTMTQQTTQETNRPPITTTTNIKSTTTTTSTTDAE